MLTEKWTKSTRSGDGGNCVEAKATEDVLVRDSKDPDGPVLDFTTDAWTGFLDRVKTGTFDL